MGSGSFSFQVSIKILNRKEEEKKNEERKKTILLEDVSDTQ
jgi:hypothetical protein